MEGHSSNTQKMNLTPADDRANVRRSPLLPRPISEVQSEQNVKCPSKSISIPVRAESVPTNGAAEASVEIDPSVNCLGFPVVRCRIHGKQRQAVYLPTPAHQNLFGYIVQSREEGAAHKEQNMSSYALMQRLTQDRQRRDEITAEIVQSDQKSGGVRHRHDHAQKSSNFGKKHTLGSSSRAKLPKAHARKTNKPRTPNYPNCECSLYTYGFADTIADLDSQIDGLELPAGFSLYSRSIAPEILQTKRELAALGPLPSVPE